MDICAFITYICGISIILNSQILLILVSSICDVSNTGIPRLKRFLVARIHFTRIFEATQKDLLNAVL